MTTLKAESAESLNSLSDNGSYDEIRYHRYVIEQIRRSTERVETAGALSHEEAKNRLSRWFKN
jgi:hypothetical protein